MMTFSTLNVEKNLRSLWSYDVLLYPLIWKLGKLGIIISCFFRWVMSILTRWPGDARHITTWTIVIFRPSYSPVLYVWVVTYISYDIFVGFQARGVIYHFFVRWINAPKPWQNKKDRTFVVMLSFFNLFCSRQLFQIIDVLNITNSDI